MARTDLTAQEVVTTGLSASYVAATVDGHMFVCNQRRILHVKNGGAGALTVTVQTDLTRDGNLALPDRTVSIPAGEDRFIGPFDASTYQQRSGADAGKVYVDYSVQTSVTVALLEVG